MEQGNKELLIMIDNLKKRIGELLEEAQPKVEDCLINDNLTISLEKLDSDFMGVSIIGYNLNLKGKALKIPTENNKQTVLSVSYLEKNQGTFF